jgi:hypothetical protein
VLIAQLLKPLSGLHGLLLLTRVMNNYRLVS